MSFNKTKGLITISSNNSGINHTPDMEKAMHQSHGMGYAEYERSIDQKLKVEKVREEEYEKSQQLVNEIERKAHR